MTEKNHCGCWLAPPRGWAGDELDYTRGMKSGSGPSGSSGLRRIDLHTLAQISIWFCLSRLSLVSATR